MLKVLVKVMTYVNGIVHKAGEEIVIADHLFSEEVHELIEDLGGSKNPITAAAAPNAKQIAEHEGTAEPESAPASETPAPVSPVVADASAPAQVSGATEAEKPA